MRSNAGNHADHKNHRNHSSKQWATEGDFQVMKRYPKYKESGVEWIGEVPEHWEIKRLKYCVSLINTKIEGKTSESSYIGLEHIESWTGRLIQNDENLIVEGQSNCFEPGDVLFGKLRPYLAKVLQVKNKGICTGELLVLRPKDISQKYLTCYMLNPNFIFIVDSSTYGAKMPRANWNFIGDLPMLIPSKNEELAIADFLDRKTSQIDALIEKKQKQIELLKKYRLALITNAVTKGLNPNVEMKDSGVDWIGKIPRHWLDNIKINSIAHKGNNSFVNGPFGSNLLTSEFQSEGVPVIYIKDISSGRYLRKSESFISCNKAMELDFCRVDSGDLLISKVGDPPGISAVYPDCEPPGIVTQDVIRMKVNNKQAIADYLSFLFNSMYGQYIIGNITVQSTRTRIGLKDLKETRIVLPAVSEQDIILNYLAKTIPKIDLMIQKNNTIVNSLKRYRTALISNAVTGKIDVREEA